MKIKSHALATTAIVLLLAVGSGAAAAAGEEQASLSRIIFFVAGYDVGQSALEGLPGVKKVTKGFKGFHEINTVYYDPQEMAAALKAAGTYRGVAEQ